MEQKRAPPLQKQKHQEKNENAIYFYGSAFYLNS